MVQPIMNKLFFWYSGKMRKKYINFHKNFVQNFFFLFIIFFYFCENVLKSPKYFYIIDFLILINLKKKISL